MTRTVPTFTATVRGGDALNAWWEAADHDELAPSPTSVYILAVDGEEIDTPEKHRVTQDALDACELNGHIEFVAFGTREEVEHWARVFQSAVDGESIDEWCVMLARS